MQHYQEHAGKPVKRAAACQGCMGVMILTSSDPASLKLPSGSRLPSFGLRICGLDRGICLQISSFFLGQPFGFEATEQDGAPGQRPSNGVGLHATITSQPASTEQQQAATAIVEAEAANSQDHGGMHYLKSVASTFPTPQ